MVGPAVKKGAEYEKHVLETYLMPIWPEARRAGSQGALDFGDFKGVGNYLVEAKKQDRWDMPAWVRVILKKTRGTAPWLLFFATDKRGAISLDLVTMPAEQYRDQLRRMMQLERMMGQSQMSSSSLSSSDSSSSQSGS